MGLFFHFCFSLSLSCPHYISDDEKITGKCPNNNKNKFLLSYVFNIREAVIPESIRAPEI